MTVHNNSTPGDSHYTNRKPSAFANFYQRLTGSVNRRIMWCGVLFVITIFLGYLFLSEDGFARNSGLKEKRIALENENLKLEEENRQLATRIERLAIDQDFLEDEARKKLGLIRPGEIVYRLAEEPDLSDREIAEQLD